MRLPRAGRRRRHATTTRGWRPTAEPCAARPRVGSGSVPGRSGPRGTAARPCATPRTGPATGAGPRAAATRGARPRHLSAAWRARRRHARPSRTRDRPPDPVHRHQRTGGQAGDDHAPDVDRPAIVDQPRGDLGDLLAGDVGDGVEHVGTRIEQEAAAGDRRILAPRPCRPLRPVLPHQGVDVEECPDLAARDHPRRGTDLRGEAARERDDEQAAGSITRGDQLLGLGRVHDHRLLEDDVKAGLHGRDRLGGMESVRRDDEGHVERRCEPLEEARPVGFVRGHGKAESGELGGRDLEGVGDGSQTATTAVSSRGSMFRRWLRAIRPVPMMPTRIASAAIGRRPPEGLASCRPGRRR